VAKYEESQDPNQPNPMRWIIAITVSLAAILEVLDTSIVNVALPYMQGNLGTTLSEIGWVITGYGIANVIMIPLAAWLGDTFGKKRYFVFSMIGFTVASVLCGLSNSLGTLIASRILQGLFGGGLLAKAQSILFQTFPKEEQGMAQSLFGMGVIVGPVIGPTLGGYLTDTLDWRWIFFINLPIGIIASLMAIAFLPPDDEIKRQNSVDWLGISLLIIMMGCIQTVLEQGQEDDWFSSSFITTLTIIGAISFIWFVWHEWHTNMPAVDLHVLRHRALSAGSVYSIILGMGLYGAIFAIPIFAQNILQYTAMETGLMMLPGALVSGLMMPIMGQLATKVDCRVLIAIGAAGTTIAMYLLSSMSIYTNADSLFWPLLLRGAAIVFMFMPLNLGTVGALPKEDIPAGTGIYNLSRQMGGSLGIAIITTILAQREQYHRSMLVEHVNPTNPAFNQQFQALTSLFTGLTGDMVFAQQQAWAALNNIVNQQSSILSFADIFWLVGVTFIVTMPLIFFLDHAGNPASVAEVH
jgi:DHA2 family multidrug resistance protein